MVTSHFDIDLDTALRRSQECWYDDGNVVLETEGVLFRVFRGILAQCSEVFRDLFSIPQPADGETIEGCPIVRVQDSALELGYFLRALHDSSFYDWRAKTSYFVVAGILRLSTKYCVPHLRRRAIAHFVSIYPTKLEHLHVASDDDLIPPFDGCCFLAVNLFRETDTLEPLPAALYVCLAYPTKHLLNGIPVNPENSDHLNVPDGLECFALSPENQRACLLARDELLSCTSTTMFCFLARDQGSGDCRNLMACNNARYALLSLIQYSLGVDISATHLQVNIIDEDDWYTLKEETCGPCYNRARWTYAEKRQELWDRIPAAFSLPPWHEVEVSR